MAIKSVITLGIGSSPGSITLFLLTGLTTGVELTEPAWVLAPIAGTFGLRRPGAPIGAYSGPRLPKAPIGAHSGLRRPGAPIGAYSGPRLPKAPIGAHLGLSRSTAVVGTHFGLRRSATPVGGMVVDTTASTRVLILIDSSTALAIDGNTAIVSEMT